MGKFDNLRKQKVKWGDKEIIFREKVGVDKLNREDILWDMGLYEDIDNKSRIERLTYLNLADLVVQRVSGGDGLIPEQGSSREEFEEALENLFYNPKFSTVCQNCIDAIRELSILGDPELDPNLGHPPEETNEQNSEAE